MYTPYQVLWGLVWPNNVAAVEWLLATVILGALLRKPIKRLTLWARREWFREVHERLDHISATADAAHRVASDAYRAQTGQEHPEAVKGRP